jgi:hypothetical protein
MPLISAVARPMTSAFWWRIMAWQRYSSRPSACLYAVTVFWL